MELHCTQLGEQQKAQYSHLYVFHRCESIKIILRQWGQFTVKFSGWDQEKLCQPNQSINRSIGPNSIQLPFINVVAFEQIKSNTTGLLVHCDCCTIHLFRWLAFFALFIVWAIEITVLDVHIYIECFAQWSQTIYVNIWIVYYWNELNSTEQKHILTHTRHSDESNTWKHM